MGQILFYKELKKNHDTYENIEFGTTIDGSNNVTEATIVTETAYNIINGIAGRSITVIINNPSDTPYDAMFLTVGGVIENLDKSVLAKTSSHYRIFFSDFGASAVLESREATFPIFSGLLGDLVVQNGQMLELQAGLTYSYRNVLIESGGLLKFLNLANTAKMTEFYTKSLTIDGTIEGKEFIPIEGTSTTPYEHIFRDTGNLALLSYQRGTGGNGGRGGYHTSGSAGAAGSGVGALGGGGSGGAAHGANSGAGGTGNGNGATYHGSGGTGGTGSAANGDHMNGGNGGGGGGGGGSTTYHTNNGNRRGGGGGGGGGLAKCGLALYLYSDQTISGNGLIDLSGSPGEPGGNGYRGYGDGGNGTPAGGGGGGGGAGGGAGGHLYIRSSGFTPSYDLSGNSGGAGGTKGANNGASHVASNGQPGSAGTSGTFTTL